MISTCISSLKKQKKGRNRLKHAICCVANNHPFLMCITAILAVPLGALLAVVLLAAIVSLPLYFILN